MIGPAPQVRGSNWQLAALLGGIVLGNVDIAIVNIAAPSIRDDLSASGLQQGRGEGATYSGPGVLGDGLRSVGSAAQPTARPPPETGGTDRKPAARHGIGACGWWPATSDGVLLIALLGLGGLGYGAAFSATLDHVTNISKPATRLT
ncbi:hypothetical protein [Saccharopolyspora pogona]|uniref:hypothetical protein n=1 Tax=Saccharopolyspora pogona TaxID=333966 RepID=UPI001688D9F9|nr:hypothetical protein [Saccharopolyspora pogona]